MCILQYSKLHLFFCRLLQSLRSSQEEEFEKEINTTIDKFYVRGEEGCEFVVYKCSELQYLNRMTDFLGIITFLNSVPFCQPLTVCV